MKIQILAIFFLTFGGINSQKIKETFILKVQPDNGWVLKFEKNGYFEYYHWNGLGGGKTLTKGKYELEKGLLSFQFVERDSAYQDEIPNELSYTKLSKNEFENFDEEVFAIKEESFLFKKRYIVLSKNKLGMD